MEDREYREKVLRDRARRRKKAAEMRRRRRRQSLTILIAGILIIALVGLGVNALFGSKDEPKKGQTQAENSQTETPDSSDSRGQDVTAEDQSSIDENMDAIENTVTEATIAAVGDVMVHDTQLEFAYNWETGEFDFWDSFEVISEHISKADYTIANLETTFGPYDTWTEGAFQGYTGYPCFNSPAILATNLKNAGIDFVGTANNHTLDSRADGIQSTIEVLDEVGLAHTGTFTEVDAPRYSIQEVNGIRIAIMAYTYGANGFVLPEESKGYFNSFDDYDQTKIDQMYKDVQEVAAMDDVDLVTVMLHMGEEYQYTPSAKTQEVVDQLFASGCDIVLGSHPHVLEPFEVRTIDNGDGTTRQGFVIYSLANFISSQYYTSETPVHKDVGVVLNMKIQKTGSEKPVITELSFLPTYCQWTTTTIRVIPIEHALNSYESGENLYALSDYNYNNMLASRDFFRNTFWPEEYEYELVDGYYVVDLQDNETDAAVQPTSSVVGMNIEDIREMPADTVLDESILSSDVVSNMFYSSDITEEIQGRIMGISYRENNNISLSELQYLRVLHYGIDGETRIGELIVNKSIAEDILDIMYELYINQYPIEKMVLIDEYKANDEASMADNNTSAFNYRTVANTDVLSNHSYGMAIDINPLYNPYVVQVNGSTMISPADGAAYADRNEEFPYKMDAEDLCVKLFIEHGFEWGGTGVRLRTTSTLRSN